MSWRVEWSTRARRELDRINPRDAERVVAAIDLLVNGGQGDFKKLHGALAEHYRLRVGSVRVLLFRADPGVLRVGRVADRRDVYR